MLENLTIAVREWPESGPLRQSEPSRQPHRAETFKLSRDPNFAEMVRDVVGLYMSPPENAVVVCVDEKSVEREGTPPEIVDRFRTKFWDRHGTPKRHS